jgi:hypothetical protein
MPLDPTSAAADGHVARDQGGHDPAPLAADWAWAAGLGPMPPTLAPQAPLPAPVTTRAGDLATTGSTLPEPGLPNAGGPDAAATAPNSTGHAGATIPTGAERSDEGPASAQSFKADAARQTLAGMPPQASLPPPIAEMPRNGAAAPAVAGMVSAATDTAASAATAAIAGALPSAPPLPGDAQGGRIGTGPAADPFATMRDQSGSTHATRLGSGMEDTDAGFTAASLTEAASPPIRPGDGGPGDGRPVAGRPGDGGWGDGDPGNGQTGNGQLGSGQLGSGQLGSGIADIDQRANGDAGGMAAGDGMGTIAGGQPAPTISGPTTTGPGSTAATGAVPAEPPLADQIRPALVRLEAGADGTQRVTIRLRPVELGQVEIRIQHEANARTQVHVLVERPETLALLRRDQAALEQALDQAGITAESRAVLLELTPADTRPVQAATAASPGGAPPSPDAQAAQARSTEAGLTGRGHQGAEDDDAGAYQPPPHGSGRERTGAGPIETATDPRRPGWRRVGLDITA